MGSCQPKHTPAHPHQRSPRCYHPLYNYPDLPPDQPWDQPWDPAKAATQTPASGSASQACTMGKCGKGTGSFVSNFQGLLEGKGDAMFSFWQNGVLHSPLPLASPCLPHSPCTSYTLSPKRLQGKRRNKTHTLCRRCGRRSYHIQKSTCSSCGYPAARIRTCEYKSTFGCCLLGV